MFRTGSESQLSAMPAPARTPVVVCGEAADAPAATIVLFGELMHAPFCWEYQPSAAATRGADFRYVPGWLGSSTRPLQKYAEVIQRVCMRGVWRCVFSVWYALRVALFSMSDVRLTSFACTHLSTDVQSEDFGRNCPGHCSRCGRYARQVRARARVRARVRAHTK